MHKHRWYAGLMAAVSCAWTGCGAHDGEHEEEEGTVTSELVTGSLTYSRVGHTETRLNDGRTLVAGGLGRSTGALAQSEIYNPTTGAWAVTAGSMATARDEHTATRLSDGRVLVAGGR